MRWSVYKITRRSPIRHLVALGYVNADDQPAALAAAWKRWPQAIDHRQVQAGFSVRPYVRDHLPLGKMHNK